MCHEGFEMELLADGIAYVLGFELCDTVNPTIA
jgi:hypothetical protein